LHWLADWLKTVIVIVMIAAFVDLLLPSNKMQRYVKTVLSLFILLALLSPVFELLRGDWNIDKLLAAAEREQAAMPALGKAAGGKLDEKAIAAEGERLKQTGERQTAELAERQIANGMKEEIARQTLFEAVDVTVKTSQDGEGRVFVSSVEATLQERKPGTESGNGGTSQPGDGAGAGGGRKTEPVEPVPTMKPVEIVVRVGESRTDQVRDQAAFHAVTDAERKAQDEVMKLLERNWGVSPERATIRFL